MCGNTLVSPFFAVKNCLNRGRSTRPMRQASHWNSPQTIVYGIMVITCYLYFLYLHRIRHHNMITSGVISIHFCFYPSLDTDDFGPSLVLRSGWVLWKRKSHCQLDSEWSKQWSILDIYETREAYGSVVVDGWPMLTHVYEWTWPPDASDSRINGQILMW